jgi:hypothetical protein
MRSHDVVVPTLILCRNSTEDPASNTNQKTSGESDLKIEIVLIEMILIYGSTECSSLAISAASCSCM